MSTVVPGAVIAGFRIEASLSQGAMAEVYRAWDEDGERVVAVKLLDAALARDERFRQRFLRESQLAASLDHPNVVRTLGSGEADGRLYLVMDLVDGSDLRQILRREGALEPERAVALVEQVASALDVAHAAGLVHRDVKPGNVLVADEHAYVCDFGLARHVASVSSLTGDRGFVGTIDYVPPEQIEGNPVDARADVYSLGCVLFECLTGARPFERDSELSVVFAHLNEPPPRATDVRPELPAAFDGVFANALAKSPDDRYSTCGELAAAARAALSGKVVARRRRHRRRLAAVGAAAAVVAVGIAALVFAEGTTHRDLPVTITPTSLGGARLGDSSITLERLWGPGYQKLSMQFPPDYSVLTEKGRHLSAYYAGTTDKAVELTTWNASDRTAEGIGPCSSLAALKKAYGKRLKAPPGSVHPPNVFAWTLGNHLLFAMGGPNHGSSIVEAVALYANPINFAGFNALNDGPCTAGAPNALVRRAITPAAAPPKLTQTFASRRFAPRITVRAPAGWRVLDDDSGRFALGFGGSERLTAFLDPSAFRGGHRLTSVSTTPLGLATWLQHDRRLTVSNPDTLLIGRPALTARSLDVIRSTAPFLAFRRFTYPSSKGRVVRLYFTPVRIGTLVHTLVIVVDSPSRTAFNRILPAARAILATLHVAAAPVVPLTEFSTQCTKVFGGTCLGELAVGTHSTSTFVPKLTYTVPIGWTNFQDQPAAVAFVPPGGDWQAGDAGLSDVLYVLSAVAAPRAPCSNPPSSIRTPAAYLRSLVDSPAIAATAVRRVIVGGLSGFVADLRIRKSWHRACPWSKGAPYVQTVVGLPPHLDGLDHGLAPQPMVMRLYLLAYHRGTLAIEIDEVAGDSKLAAYSKVVQSFRFAGG